MWSFFPLSQESRIIFLCLLSLSQSRVSCNNVLDTLEYVSVYVCVCLLLVLRGDLIYMSGMYNNVQGGIEIWWNFPRFFRPLKLSSSLLVPDDSYIFRLYDDTHTHVHTWEKLWKWLVETGRNLRERERDRGYSEWRVEGGESMGKFVHWVSIKFSVASSIHPTCIHILYTVKASM